MPVDRWIDRPRESSNCIVYYCLMADGRAQQEGTGVDLPAIGNKLIVNVHSDRIDLLIIFNEAIVPHHLLFICTPPPSLINHHIFE